LKGGAPVTKFKKNDGLYVHSQPSNNVGQKKNLMTSEQEYLMKRTFHSTKQIKRRVKI
jgi:hypothetical protein